MAILVIYRLIWVWNTYYQLYKSLKNVHKLFFSMKEIQISMKAFLFQKYWRSVYYTVLLYRD